MALHKMHSNHIEQNGSLISMGFRRAAVVERFDIVHNIIMIRSPYAPLERKQYFPIANRGILCGNVNYDFSIRRGKRKRPIVLLLLSLLLSSSSSSVVIQYKVEGLYILCERKTSVLCA